MVRDIDLHISRYGLKLPVYASIDSIFDRARLMPVPVLELGICVLCMSTFGSTKLIQI